jgi:hypothetical protein
MGYLRTSLARAQGTRSESALAKQHGPLRSIGKHEITTAWTTPGGTASPDVGVTPPGQAAAPGAHAAEMVSEALGSVQAAERRGHISASSTSAATSIQMIENTATGAIVSARAQPGQAVIPAPMNVRRDDFKTQPKTVTLHLREEPRIPLPEMSGRNTAEAAKTAESAARKSLVETQSEAAPPQNFSPVSTGRTDAVKTPVFHVNWLEGNRSIPQAAREKVEREVVRAARAEFRARAETANAEQPSVEIRVEHLTVKIENPTTAPPAPPPASRRTTPAGSAPDFSDYFLRRSISGF